MRQDEKDLESTVARLSGDISKVQEAKRNAGDSDLQLRWRAAIKTFETSKAEQHGSADYPRMDRLYEIVRSDGKIKLMLGYAKDNLEPDLTNEGKRRTVEALLKFERPLEQLIQQAGKLWEAGDFEGEASLLEEYAIRNPQKDAILDLAAEARRDALSGASARTKPKRR